MDAHAQRMRHSSKEPNWRTPPPMVEKLRNFGDFTIDLAADATSSVCGHAFFGPGSPIGRNGLHASWGEHARCGFLNPPYSIGLIKELRARDGGTDAATIAALRIESWADKAYAESLEGFTTIAVVPYAPQTRWWRTYVMGHVHKPLADESSWSGHAALDFFRVAHRVPFLTPDGLRSGGANVNTAIVIWGPNPGFVGPWVPSGRYWSYR